MKKTKKPDLQEGKKPAASLTVGKSASMQSMNHKDNQKSRIVNGLSFIDTSQESLLNVPRSGPQEDSRRSESPEYNNPPYTCSREVLLKPGYLKSDENYTLHCANDPILKEDEEPKKYQLTKYYNNSDLSGPSGAKKAIDNVDPPTRSLLRSSVDSVKAGWRGLESLAYSPELAIRWTIPFDVTNKDEVLKISGPKGTHRFTIKQCAPARNWEDAYSYIHANLPMRRSETMDMSFPIIVRFRLKEPFDSKACQDDARKAWQIVFARVSLGLRLSADIRVEIQYKHSNTGEKAMAELDRIERELNAIGADVVESEANRGPTILELPEKSGKIDYFG